MEIFFSIVNTLLLVILFFYQKYRNKILEDHLSEQSKLIDETKSVVTQQATALEGQSKVVETALKYTESFDLQKIEMIIRREVEMDNKLKLDQLKKDFEDQISKTAKSKQNFKEFILTLINTAASTASEAATNYISPFMPYIIQSLILMPKEERSRAIKALPDPFQSNLSETISKAEAELLKSFLIKP